VKGLLIAVAMRPNWCSAHRVAARPSHARVFEAVPAPLNFMHGRAPSPVRVASGNDDQEHSAMNQEPPIDFNDPVWAILRSLPSMLSYWDRDLRCRFANRAHEDWFGVKPSQLFDSALIDLLGPEIFARSEPYIRGVLRGEPQEFDRVPTDSERIHRPGLVNFLPHIVNGKVIGFVVQVTDVTRLYDMQVQLQQQVDDKEKALAALQKSSANLRQAQALGQIGSWTLDAASGAMTWSLQLHALFGRDPAAGPPSFQEHAVCYTPESWQRLVQTVDQAVKNGEPYTLELEYVHSSGRRGWLEARGASQRDERGGVTALYGTAQEITGRRLAGSVESQTQRIIALEAELLSREARIAELERMLALAGKAR
jgi:PAS domain-containing protein